MGSEAGKFFELANDLSQEFWDQTSSMKQWKYNSAWGLSMTQNEQQNNTFFRYLYSHSRATMTYARGGVSGKDMSDFSAFKENA